MLILPPWRELTNECDASFPPATANNTVRQQKWEVQSAPCGRLRP